MVGFKIKNFEFFHTYNADGNTFFFDTHCHNTYELYMLVNGNVDYTVGDKTFSLKPFDLLLIPPQVFHCPHAKHGPYERIVFNFNDKDIRKDLQPLLKELSTLYYVKNHIFFRSIALEFSDSFSKLPQKVVSFSIKNLIELCLIELSLLEPVTEHIATCPQILSQIIEYIDNNLDKNLAQGHIAKKFFVTAQWINYSFKKYFNVCYSHYIKSKKMTYAQSLLQNGISPKVVSSMCGFDTYTTFLRQYKSFFQRVPISDYVES